MAKLISNETLFTRSTLADIKTRVADLKKRVEATAVTLKGHLEDVLSVSFSPDGRRIVSGCADNTLKVWDAEP